MTPRSFAASTLCFIAAVAPPATRASTPDGAVAYHIRAADPDLRTLLDEGMRLSPAFRAIVQRIVGSDVIVFVQTDVQAPPRTDGRLTFLTSAFGHRYILVRLRPQRQRYQLLAILGHELRHVVEVAETPAIVDEPSLAAEYRRLGFERPTSDSSLAFDTDAAIEAGYQVLAEVDPELRRHTVKRRRPTLALHTEPEAAQASGP